MRTALPKLIVQRPSSSLHIRSRAAGPSKSPGEAITYQKCIAICLRLRGGGSRGLTSPLTDVECLVADGSGGERNLELATITSLDRSPVAPSWATFCDCDTQASRGTQVDRPQRRNLFWIPSPPTPKHRDHGLHDATSPDAQCRQLEPASETSPTGRAPLAVNQARVAWSQGPSRCPTGQSRFRPGTYTSCSHHPPGPTHGPGPLALDQNSGDPERKGGRSSASASASAGYLLLSVRASSQLTRRQGGLSQTDGWREGRWRMRGRTSPDGGRRTNIDSNFGGDRG